MRSVAVHAYDYPLILRHLLHGPFANAWGQEIIDAAGARYTYAALEERLCRVANALKELGVGPGSVVAVMDWDSHRYFECFFAVPMLGATLHTINVRLSLEQILYTINHAGDDVILVHADFLPVLSGIASRIVRPVKLVLMADLPIPVSGEFAGEYEEIVAAASPVSPFGDFDERTRATLFYTTGTTGEPKGVNFSHRQLVLHTLAVASWLGSVPGAGGFNRADVYMPITPLFHVHGWGIPYVATMLGVKQVYPGRYEPAKLLQLIAEHGVTFSHCVPTILAMLLDAPAANTTDLSRWKVLIGGSALPRSLAERALARGIDIHAAYGLSETCPFLTVADMVASRESADPVAVRTAAGRALPLVQLMTVDAAMEEIARDGVSSGEVVARAPWLTETYLGNDAATAELWRGGYLHTGDVGRIDADGTLKITDRLKDVIKSGGEWISSLDLEDITGRAEGVLEAAAIGVADAKWGERPLLVVRLAPGADEASSEQSIRDEVTRAIEAGRLSRWAMPDRIVFMPALPRTSVGKLDKKALRVTLAAC
jgi:fatty-acyl-CoA synthase